MKESKLANVCVLFMDTVPLNQLSLPDHHPVHLFIYLLLLTDFLVNHVALRNSDSLMLRWRFQNNSFCCSNLQPPVKLFSYLNF